jgi:hypothetical protein
MDRSEVQLLVLTGRAAGIRFETPTCCGRRNTKTALEARRTKKNHHRPDHSRAWPSSRGALGRGDVSDVHPGAHDVP